MYRLHPDIGRSLVWIGAGVPLGARVVFCAGINSSGVGVGVGDCADDLGRLYLIWLNPVDAANDTATVAMMIGLIIKQY